MSRNKNKKLGAVYWGKTRFIHHEKKQRRRYMIVKHNSDNSIQVSEIESIKPNNKKVLIPIKMYNGLTKKSGVYPGIYKRNRVTKDLLKLDSNVFDKEPLFVVDDDDWKKVKTKLFSTKNNKRFRN